MTDVILTVGGKSKRVKRDFRADDDGSDVEYTAYEYADVLRVNEKGHVVGDALTRIRPGMFVYTISDDLKDETFDTCKKRLDCLPVYYVSEIIAVGDVAQRKEGDSDNAEVYLSPCRLIGEVKGGKLKGRARLNDTDLVVGDQPFYASIDSVLMPMPALVGPGHATPGFDGKRRVSHAALGVDDDFEFVDGESCRIVPLSLTHAVLQTFEDVAEFMWYDDTAAEDDEYDDSTNDDASPPKAKAKTPPSSAKRKKRDDAEEKATPANKKRDTTIAKENPPGAPMAPVTPMKALPDVVVSPTPLKTPPAKDTVPGSPKARVTFADPVPPLSRAAPPPPPTLASSQRDRSSAASALKLPPPPKAPSPNGSDGRVRRVDVDEEVDLNSNAWHVLKPQLAKYILALLHDESEEEALFRRSIDVRRGYKELAQTWLGGAFGDFVDETVFSDEVGLIKFTARFAPPLNQVAYVLFLRPVAYTHLCALAMNVKPLPPSILARAAELRLALKGAASHK